MTVPFKGLMVSSDTNCPIESFELVSEKMKPLSSPGLTLKSSAQKIEIDLTQLSQIPSDKRSFSIYLVA